MGLAPIGLIAFSLSHATLSWSETQHLRNAELDQWIQHLTNIQGRWLAAHLGGIGLFPLIGMTIWWMLPRRGIVSSISKVALIVYVPLYIAVDAVLGIGSSILIHYREGICAGPEPLPTLRRDCRARARGCGVAVPGNHAATSRTIVSASFTTMTLCSRFDVQPQSCGARQ